MRRVLIIGASGFIGSYFVKRISEYSKEFSVEILGQGELAGVRLGMSKTLAGSLSKTQPFDIEINIAAYLGDSPEKTVQSNFHGLHDVLDYCNSGGVKKLIHISRSFSVNKIGDVPVSTRCGSLYEYSKFYAELVLEKLSNIPVDIIRITAPIWPTMSSDRYLSQILLSIINKKPVRIYGQGKRIQNYVRLDDIGAAIIKSARNFSKSPMLNNPILVCGPENFSDFEFARAVYERLGVEFEYSFYQPDKNIKIDDSDYSINFTAAHRKFKIADSRSIDSSLLMKHIEVIERTNLRIKHT